ncbi:MAG: hypothetical protein ACO3RK_04840 [Luteolibacter sp.]
MKSHLAHSLLAATALGGISLAQTTGHTNPLGFTTQTLGANRQNLVGLNLMKRVIAAGSFTAVSGPTISDSQTNFSQAIPAGKMAVLEITSGAAAGTVQDFAVWNENSITLPAEIPGLAVGDTYKVRLTHTLQELFPAGTLTAALSASNADKVWIPTGPGTYDRYWYKSGNPVEWHRTSDGKNDTGLVTSEVSLLYIDGIIVEKKASAHKLVLSGEVKTTGSNVLLGQGQNLISVVPPTGATLFASGLQGDIASSAKVSTSDIVWVPSGANAYTKYWYKSTAPTGWRITSGSKDLGAVSADVPLPPSIFIQRRSATPTVVTMDVPNTYSSL